MADTINDKTEPTTGPIRTLVFEYAKAPNYQCTVCRKSILAKSLCIATIERANKKQKKKTLKPLDTTHFKCWTVPEEFRTQPKPLEVFRGFAGLKSSDKKRIERMKEAGAGTTWAALMAADEAEKQELLEQEELEKVDDQKKPTTTTTKRKKTVSDEDTDMTQALTGGQINKSRSNKKIKTDSAESKDNKVVKEDTKKESTKKDTKKESTKKESTKKESTKKNTKKESIKKAPKQLDEIHGEGFEDDLANILKDFKQ